MGRFVLICAIAVSAWISLAQSVSGEMRQYYIGFVALRPHDIKLKPEGFRLKRDINHVVSNRSERLMYCYDKTLKSDTRSEGSVTMLVDIKENGSVARAIVKVSDIEDSDFLKCLVNAFNRMDFWHAKHEVVATIPLSFSYQIEERPEIEHKLPTNPIYRLPPDSADPIEN